MAMINLYCANVIGIKWNCLYPNHVEVTDEKTLLSAVIRDYVCAEYKGNYRSKDNFISSDCLPVDCDNDHSENPAEWITPDDVAQAFLNGWMIRQLPSGSTILPKRYVRPLREYAPHGKV